MADRDGLLVRGGVGGVTARLEDLAQTARLLRSLAAEFTRHGGAVAAIAADPRLLCTELLSPPTFAAAEVALAAASVGPHGLFALAARLEAIGVSITAAAAAYRAADAGAAIGLQAVEVFSGRIVGAAAPMLSAPLIGAAVGSTVGVMLFGADGDGAGADAERGGRPSDALRRLGLLTLGLLVNHPGVTDRLVPAAPGVVGGSIDASVGLLPGGLVIAASVFGRSGGPVTVKDLTGGIGVIAGLAGVAGMAGRSGAGQQRFADPGPVSVRASPVTWSRPAADLGELVARVPSSNHGSPRVHVERIDGDDGRRRWVVSVPGTASWSLVSGRTPFDLTGDLRLMAGDRSSGMAGVVEAMRAVGVRKGEPVMLVGHSQGGLIAAAVASDPAVRREFTVSRVLTTGAPIGSMPIPDDVQVLSLEHREDLVPRLDGAVNHDRPNWVTVSAPAPAPAPAQAQAQAREPLWAHSLDLYQQTADRAARSPDPSIVTWRAGAAPFLSNYQNNTAWDVEIRRLPTS
jgi:hypothetical protein